MNSLSRFVGLLLLALATFLIPSRASPSAAVAPPAPLAVAQKPVLLPSDLPPAVPGPAIAIADVSILVPRHPGSGWPGGTLHLGPMPLDALHLTASETGACYFHVRLDQAEGGEQAFDIDEGGLLLWLMPVCTD